MWEKVTALNLKTTCKIDQKMWELQDKVEIHLIQHNGADWLGLFDNCENKHVLIL